MKKIEEIVNQYSISHKGNVQCKCISGAKGHLIAKLNELFEKELQKAFDEGGNTAMSDIVSNPRGLEI